MRYRVLKNVCEGILKGDEVEIISSYGYMMGTDIRIKDYFELGPNEVVIKKINKVDNCKTVKEKLAFVKCKKDLLEIIK